MDAAPDQTSDQPRGRNSEIANNIANIRERILSAGGSESVRIVGVTKRHSLEVVRDALALGLTDLAENYAQELSEKALSLVEFGPPQPNWHFIGQLQTNKVRKVAPFVSSYDSVDRESLVVALAKHAPGAACLIQVGAESDGGRGGCSISDLPHLVESVTNSGLHLQGLMTVAPLGLAESAIAAWFSAVRAACDEFGLSRCSMGMSEDLELAVEAGATEVRIGSAIFGSRYSG
ncbi:MAG TPA: YggS family pyridoxal phosphate-dependent enzyme [Acidimicrobiaceae bacterium]|jgi:pyridoxal phosphate enzyme (YggS family)|nr:YggS family pyridoxal phosphate-dependent enzyme [Acidimicrobiaceae bacterium]